jgi:hypothetical protein
VAGSVKLMAAMKYLEEEKKNKENENDLQIVDGNGNEI